MISPELPSNVRKRNATVKYDIRRQSFEFLEALIGYGAVWIGTNECDAKRQEARISVAFRERSQVAVGELITLWI